MPTVGGGMRKSALSEATQLIPSHSQGCRPGLLLSNPICPPGGPGDSQERREWESICLSAQGQWGGKPGSANTRSAGGCSAFLSGVPPWTPTAPWEGGPASNCIAKETEAQNGKPLVQGHTESKQQKRGSNFRVHVLDPLPCLSASTNHQHAGLPSEDASRPAEGLKA